MPELLLLVATELLSFAQFSVFIHNLFGLNCV